jgi:hypothetical protein
MEQMRDYFGEPIFVGDKVLRPMYSELHVETVAKLTPRAIHFERNDQWSIKRKMPPLRVSINHWWSTEKCIIKLKNDDND